MQHALELTVEVGEDHLVKLPEKVPVGPVEIIVLVEAPATQELLEDFEPIQPSKPLGLAELVIEDRG